MKRLILVLLCGAFPFGPEAAKGAPEARAFETDEVVLPRVWLPDRTEQVALSPDGWFLACTVHEADGRRVVRILDLEKAADSGWIGSGEIGYTKTTTCCARREACPFFSVRPNPL